ncbi:MAG: response regulator, partial [Gammaproteobacteria bacterium]|nr:response regulator [Gammaproteobacteria bacterium]
QKTQLKTVRASGKILLRIVSDILDMSKIDAGKLDLEFAPVSLDTLLKQSFSLVLLDAQAKGLEIVQQRPSILPEALVVDGGRLQQIVTNLLSNAVKYSDAGVITVDLNVKPLDDGDVWSAIAAEFPEASGHWQQIQISVTDQGEGIPEHELGRLFEPFTRLGRQSDANSAGSSGLGLAICERLSEIMGGDMSVTSEVGKGTTFTLRVPCWLPGVAVEAEDESDSIEITNISALHQNRDHLLASSKNSDRLQRYLNMAQDKPLSILIADDYDVNRMVLLSQLESLGYRADAVANGEEVLRALHARPYDVVLMDVRMPVIDGVEATQKIRGRVDSPQPFIAAVTASALKGDREKYLEAGMDAYISKPVDVVTLGETLESAYAARNGSERPPWEDDLVDMNPVDIQLDELRTRLGPALESLLSKVIPVYLRELPGRIEKLEAAMANGDSASFAQYCHGLKGTSTSIGAAELADLCSRYELGAYDGELPDADAFSEFKDLAIRTDKALRRTLREIA